MWDVCHHPPTVYGFCLQTFPHFHNQSQILTLLKNVSRMFIRIKSGLAEHKAAQAAPVGPSLRSQRLVKVPLAAGACVPVLSFAPVKGSRQANLGRSVTRCTTSHTRKYDSPETSAILEPGTLYNSSRASVGPCHIVLHVRDPWGGFCHIKSRRHLVAGFNTGLTRFYFILQQDAEQDKVQGAFESTCTKPTFTPSSP